MSEQAAETPQDEGINLQSLSSDAAFGALMDVLVADETGAEAPAAAEAGAAGADGAAGAAGQVGEPAAAGGAPAGPADPGPDAAAGAAAGAPADAGGAAGGDQGAGAGTATGDAAGGGGSAVPADWTAEPAALTSRLGELSTAFETKVAQEFQDTALADVRKEHGQYFDALEKHPRLLVGHEVPAIGKEGMEVLRDTEDAKEWQEAVKSILVQEVKARASKTAEESKSFLETVHASIELFQNNPDLVPGGKGFDVDLANRFATLAKPYELRVEGKLRGYSIPVQPIIDQLREQVARERAAKPPVTGAAGAAAPASTGTPAAAPAPQDAPQAGIPSKAGNGDGPEDFSTLFGTIGLPNLRI